MGREAGFSGVCFGILSGLLAVVILIPALPRLRSPEQWLLWLSLTSVCVLLGTVSASVLRSYRRLRGKEVGVSEAGIELRQDETPTLTLSWPTFGGYAFERRRGLRGWFQESTLVILDRRSMPLVRLEGVAVPPSPAVGRTASSSDWRLFFRALDAHSILPLPPRPSPFRPKPAPRKPVWIAAELILGFGIFAAASWVVRRCFLAAIEGPSDGWAWSLVDSGGGLLGLPAVLIGFIFLSSGAMDLVRRRSASVPGLDEPLSDPEEGPILDAHRSRHSGRPAPIELVPGNRYRTVHPEARRAELVASHRQSTILALFWGGFGPLALYVAFLEGRVTPEILEWAACFTLTVALPWAISNRAFRARVAALDDVVVRTEDQIVVVRPDGTHLAFDPGRGSLPGRLLGIETLRNGRQSYPLDRRNLYRTSPYEEHWQDSTGS